MLPWSATEIGPDSSCAKTTTSLCGSFAPGCRAVPRPEDVEREAEAYATATPEEAPKKKARVQNEGLPPRYVALVSVGGTLCSLVLGFVIVRFLVMPWYVLVSLFYGARKK